MKERKQKYVFKEVIQTKGLTDVTIKFDSNKYSLKEIREKISNICGILIPKCDLHLYKILGDLGEVGAVNYNNSFGEWTPIDKNCPALTLSQSDVSPKCHLIFESFEDAEFYLQKIEILELLVLDSINNTTTSLDKLIEFEWYNQEEIDTHLWVEDGYLFDDRVDNEMGQYCPITGWGLFTNLKLDDSPIFGSEIVKHTKVKTIERDMEVFHSTSVLFPSGEVKTEEVKTELTVFKKSGIECLLGTKPKNRRR